MLMQKTAQLMVTYAIATYFAVCNLNQCTTQIQVTICKVRPQCVMFHKCTYTLFEKF